MRKSMPSHYQIFQYWKDKMIHGQTVVYDKSAPECWACGLIVNDIEDFSDLKSLWNSIGSSLQKCHIIPKALGGTYEEENIFLMCDNCHQEAPNTTSRDAFINWVALKREDKLNHNPYKDFHNQVDKYCKFYKIEADDFCRYVAARDNSQIEAKTNTHGLHKLNSSTFIMAWINEYISNK